MPSPFPGMDPYLEHPARWGGVRARLVAVIGELLTALAAPRFFVDSEDAVYVLGLDDPARPLVRPDLAVIEADHPAAPAQQRGRIATPTVLDLQASLELRLPYLKIIDTADRQVVTIIEVLSPINKAAGSSGQREFVRKREQLFRSSSHWLEIDLLRAGSRPPAIPLRGDYDAALHRAGWADRPEAWFASLREPLPIVAVPLRAPFEDLALDLQRAVGTLYDRYRYDTAIDYREPPPSPPLSEDDARWLRERIAAWQRAERD